MSVLVAGIGNVFLGDDGFGVEVVRRLDAAALPESVSVADYGIRGVHLAYDLVDGDVETLVLVDAVPLGEPPGTVAVLDVDDRPRPPAAVDAHAMGPDLVLATLERLGGRVGRVVVVGCQPADLGEGIGLSPAVAAAVPVAARLVAKVAGEAAGTRSAPGAEEHAGVPSRGGTAGERSTRAGTADESRHSGRRVTT